MAGWNLKRGLITDYNASEDKIWSLFNFVFSDSSRKRNTYKFGLIKSLIDNIFNGELRSTGVYYSYSQIFARFAENYWNLVAKYGLKQMRPDAKSIYSNVEKIIMQVVSKDAIIEVLDFDSLEGETKEELIKEVTSDCKQCVLGALYEDFDGIIYEFDLKNQGLTLNNCVYEFILKYKAEIEKLNYYSWAKFLEKVNDDNILVRVIDKLELSTPHRENLSVYRELLKREFQVGTCFYCGKKITNKVHVDHFIPWSFAKDDKLWNFVLACPTCNTKKNNKIPTLDYLVEIEKRNSIIINSNNLIVKHDFEMYSDDLLRKMWNYAKLSGLKEYVR